MIDLNPLGPRNIRHLEEVCGWLWLGNATEAAAELDRISPELRDHPCVLLGRIEIARLLKDWPAAESVALRLSDLHPDVPDGWINLAYARRRIPGGGVKSAYDTLVPMGDEFPEEPMVPFNLACYACQLNELGVARAWFQKAFRCGEKKIVIALAQFREALGFGETKTIREMALLETDLEPLWPWIRERYPQPQAPSVDSPTRTPYPALDELRRHRRPDP